MKEENENIKDEESVNNTQNETNENVTDADNKAEETTDKNEEDGVKDGTEEKETDPLEAALNEIAQLKDKYLRSVAEFDNYRKRTLKEKAELILNGSEKAVQAILPIIDDMERALANSEKTEDAEVLKEGMKLIYQKTNKIMEGLGVKKIDTTDADFDTNFHEAVAMVPGMGDEKKGKVLDCVQTGYTLNDKVIRHAKVAVGQ
ncbi:protein GrpE [Prevotella sp. CAG:1058]|nr:protein GrpE [Prevotella sp. CAG:1058]